MAKLYSFFTFAVIFLISIGANAQTVVYTNSFAATAGATTVPQGTPTVTFTNVLGDPTYSGVQLGGTDGVTTFTDNQLAEWVAGGPYVIVGTSTTNSYSQTTALLSGYSAPFSPTLSANPSVVQWTFNMETSVAASGFTDADDNAVVVLAGTNANVGTAGNGYAVAFNPATPKAIELIRYTGGIQGTVTTIISSSVLLANGTRYASVRVTYDPVTNTWTLYVRDDGNAGFANPFTGVTTSGGTAVNATYTGTPMSVFGFFSNHTATSISLLVYIDADAYSYFDNYTVSLDCIVLPVTGTFTVCQGATTTLSDATTGGTWSAGAGVTIGSVTGIVTGGTTGTSTITYTTGAGCTANAIVTVIASPAAISGITSVCQGSTTSLSDATGAGTWVSTATGFATVGSTTGLVLGVLAPGTSTISFTLTSTGCATSTVVTVNPLPTAILGNPVVCVGLSTTLSDAGGGTWTSSNANATIGSGTGLLTGVTGSTTSTITYTLGTGCYTTTTATINPLPSAINGVTNICAGLSSPLSDAITGGTWVSDNTGVATVGSTSGLLGGVANGTCHVTYTLPTGCLIFTTVSVNPTPTAIAGVATVCEGLTTSLSDGVSGGIWTSSNANATVGSLTGIVSGVTAGLVTISYTTATCTPVLYAVTVNPSPATISGNYSVCNGLSTTLSDAVTGGTWVSTNPGIASIGSSSGFVSGLSVGTVNITYTLPAGCNTSIVFTVNPSPVAISGTPQVCLGLSTTLSNAGGGGTWSSNNGNATVGSITGIVTGNIVGTSTISYLLPAGCFSTVTFTVNPLPATISGLASGCAGLVINLSDATTGGTWSSGSPGIAPVGSSSGIVTGSSVGTATITYTIPTGCIATIIVTVNASPLAITGIPVVCVGSTVLLNDPAIGGTWSSSNPLAGTIGSTSGIVTGIGMGTSTITYTLPIGGCTSTATLTVNPVPTAINGLGAVCVGSSMLLTDATTGGTWSSVNPSIATIGSVTGIVNGVAQGTATISYSLGTGCAATDVITVNPLPANIAGASIVCIGLSTTLSDLSTGGTWSSSTPGVATVGSLTGVVSGVAAGATIISYTLPTGCINFSVVSVNTPPTAISGPNTVCKGFAITLSDGTSPGTWHVTNASGSASITTTGIVTGLSVGTVLVSYTTVSCNPATLPVTINALPAVITGNGSVCFGSSIVLSDATVGGTWSSSNAAVGVSSAGVVTGLTPGLAATISYTLPTGCYVTVPVSVDSIPAPIQGIDSVCPGSSIVLSDVTAGGVWSSSDGTIAQSIALTGQVNGLVSGIVNISYTTVSGCYALVPFKVITPLPASLVISASAVDTFLCSSTSDTLVAQSVNGGDATYVWEKFGSYFSSGDTLIYPPTHGDYISCTMTTHNICASPAIVEANITLNIWPLVSPLISITTLQSDTMSYLGEEYTFFADVTYGGTAPTYQWYINSTAMSGATSSSFTTHMYNANDTVYCAVNGTSPCDVGPFAGSSNNIIIRDLSYLSTGSLPAGHTGLSLFPDPNNGDFTLSGSVKTAREIAVEVVDMLGHVVYHSAIIPQSGSVHAEIKLGDDIAAGSYLLHINTETGTETFHFVVGK